MYCICSVRPCSPAHESIKRLLKLQRSSATARSHCPARSRFLSLPLPAVLAHRSCHLPLLTIVPTIAHPLLSECTRSLPIVPVANWATSARHSCFPAATCHSCRRIPLVVPAASHSLLFLLISSADSCAHPFLRCQLLLLFGCQVLTVVPAKLLPAHSIFPYSSCTRRPVSTYYADSNIPI